jgi:uncharacterized membrane protein
MRFQLLAAAAACLTLSACATDMPGSGPVLNGVDLSRPVRALGNEPFWAVTIDSSLTLARPDYPTLTASNPGPSMSGSSAVYVSTLSDGSRIRVTLTAGTCSDGMSDRTYRLRSRVEVGANTVLTGCAESVEVLNQPPRP